mmetsp:Transcript_25656/g.39752  ORF Transcript_25656/g.39752 Transcript_25656/m.39752 type:complete len:785 (+) Transcript_25656:323-2677(+)
MIRSNRKNDNDERRRFKWWHCIFRRKRSRGGGRNKSVRLFKRRQARSRRNDDHHDDNDDDSSTAAGTLVSVSAQATAAIMKQKRQERNRHKHQASEWMCNCCGAVFPSYEVADVHEDECVRLFWLRNFAATDDTSSSALQPPDVGIDHGELSFPSGVRFCGNRDRTWSVMTGDSDHAVTTVTGTRSKKSDKGKGVAQPPTIDAICTLINTKLVKYLLTHAEIEAERKLEVMRQERIHIAEEDRMRDKRARRQGGALLVDRVKRKLQEAVALIREDGSGEGTNSSRADQYTRYDYDKLGDIPHGGETLYVNVIVKQSVQVIERELERLARQRWSSSYEHHAIKSSYSKEFQNMRAFAQRNVIKLASLALSSDFTPRRICIQMSNDFYRLLPMELAKRGVIVDTEIEYRVGAFFVLGVNIKSIEWTKLIAHTHQAEVSRQKRNVLHLPKMSHQSDRHSDISISSSSHWLYRARIFPTKSEAISKSLSTLYHLNWIISVPLCYICYFFLFSTTNVFIITSVTDDIFRYVEQRGMEMDMQVKQSNDQTAFMLSGLRELRAEERRLHEYRRREKVVEVTPELERLLGPLVKEDITNEEVYSGTPPDNLTNICLDMQVPVGYLRLRRALLYQDSRFMNDAVMRDGAKYEKISIGEWSKHTDEIGLAQAGDMAMEQAVGASQEISYVMPKSIFVKANKAFEKSTIMAYNDDCFVLRNRTRTPEVPYGEYFCTWTQLVVMRDGRNCCRMVCSSEAEFVDGRRPMVARQIESGIRRGTTEYFLLFGQIVCRHA